ncbi:hypothetical protein LEP1GSC123_2373 [Leptospira borgpetersenii str. 200701203]|uniref:Uncharacterized protein n=1 Tax=Leptospira borgpetersenii str. 200701203 TaxID=1193007 RepID=M3GHB8_LEPBO|nr:hypothetical protein LEP1GSC123_2373 [Leptospira borgpetersenii str. 200701203]
MNGDIAVFAGSSNKQIAEEICTHLNIQPGKINLKNSPTEKFRLKWKTTFEEEKCSSFNPLLLRLTII